MNKGNTSGRGNSAPIIFYTLSMEQYLHGHCDEYIDIEFKDGDVIISLIEFDYTIDKNCLLHCFIQRGDKFIDARGEMISFEEVLSEYDYGEFDVYEHTNLKEFHSFINKILYSGEDVIE